MTEALEAVQSLTIADFAAWMVGCFVAEREDLMYGWLQMQPKDRQFWMDELMERYRLWRNAEVKHLQSEIRTKIHTPEAEGELDEPKLVGEQS
jgi:hypothetical protein